jgi:DNA mismatch repair protein MutS
MGFESSVKGPESTASGQEVSTTPPAIEGATPFMAQYLEMKRNHPDALLFFRMGD